MSPPPFMVDAVAAAAGDPDRLSAALAALDEEFSVLTGREARRPDGEMYAGRTICVEERVRDCRPLRAAHRVGGDQVRLTVSEMYPTAEQAWLTDATGRRYLPELRIQVTDSQTSQGGRRG